MENPTTWTRGWEAASSRYASTDARSQSRHPVSMKSRPLVP